MTSKTTSSLLSTGDWVLLGLPDGGQRLVQLKKDVEIDLGRFGRFSGNQLVNTLPGLYYEVGVAGEIVRMDPGQLQVTGIDDDDIILATNQTLSDTNTSQKLSSEDIETLKSQLSPQQLVEKVIEHSETFSAKNAHSQQKYVQRKRRKFLRWFCSRAITARSLCGYFGGKDPRRIHDLRLDSLSQILGLANIQAENCCCLVWDETNGFMTGALLSHMTGDDSCLLHVHPDRQMQVSTLSYFNLTDNARSRLMPLPWDEIDTLISFKETEEDFCETDDAPPEQTAIQKARFMDRLIRRRKINRLLVNARFDTLVICGNTNPQTLFLRLSPFLRPSAKVIVYSSYRELLLPLYMHLRADDCYLDVSFTESWMRPYQAVPGRIHPSMNCNGHTGSILGATKIKQTPKPSRQ